MLLPNWVPGAGTSARIRLWNGRTFDLTPNPSVTFTIRRPSALRHFVRPTLTSLGTAYVEGGIGVEGSLREAIELGEQWNQKSPGPTLSSYLRLPRSLRRESKAVSYHYDVSDDFYRLFLDRNLVYSCAYFESGDEDIHTAQARKLDYVCRKLRLSPGDKLLDVGCGWGALMIWAAKHYGVRVTGITLSRNQFDYVKRRLAQEGLTRECDVQLADYRALKGNERFDKIVSVGMVEHVGRAHMDAYFATLFRLLRRGGILLNHGINSPDAAARRAPDGRFMDKYVFPLAQLPRLADLIHQSSQAGFEPVDVETLRPHYALTLRHWATRLEMRRAEAVALAGEKRTRIWLAYLHGCALAFERGWITISQILLNKDAALPLTRAHLYYTNARNDQ